MYVRLLGPLELGEDRATLTAPKPRTVLALLLARANTVVPVDAIVDELWDDRPPSSARDNVRVYVTVLRRALAAVPGRPTLVRRGPGYLLTIEPAVLDVHGFRDLVRQGRQAMAGDPDTAAGLLDRGLRVWRGRALADVPAGPTLTAWRSLVEQERLSALEEYAEVLLGLGATGRAEAQARELLLAEPLRERGHELLVRARYQAGDVAGALAAVDAARRRLADELGVEPGERLRELHRAILNRDPALRVAATGAVPAPAPVPRQLPADVATFTGREEFLHRLDELVPGPEGGPAAVVISAIAGTAGIGKTALAVHWAHRVADRFPDGQLYVNLRGFDLGGTVMSTAEAVRGFLDALAVPAQQIPASFTAQVGLYRSLLAGKRMLVVLDNARDAEQVRPLLPGSPGCLVLVTSRNQLTGLVAAEHAHLVRLGMLSRAEAGELLARRLGADRAAAEPEAVDEIIARCARLPLALAIVAARAATRPEFPLTVLAEELPGGQGGLDALAGDDAATDLRAVFSWSYLALSAPAARLFRLLGLHPGPDLSAPAAASLAGVPVAQVRPLLAELTRAHLVDEHTPGRYAFHDLLRVYAAELVSTVDVEADRRAATHRVLDHYVQTAFAAAMLINPYRDSVPVSAARAGALVLPLADRSQAMDWLTREHPVLLAAVEQAAGAGFDLPACLLAWALVDFLETRGRWASSAAALRIAVGAAERVGEPAWPAHTRYHLARAYLKLGRPDDARILLHQALVRYQRLGDRRSSAATLLRLCFTMGRDRRHAEALRYALAAFELHRALGNVVGQADALNSVGWHRAHLGDYDQARADCRQALDLHLATGDRRGQAATWDSLGFLHHRAGDFAQAVACYRTAVGLRRELGSRYLEAGSLARLGDAHHAADDPAAARDAWQRALSILEELGHPDAEAVRGKLAGPR